MSVAYSISIQDKATPAVRELIAKCSPGRLNQSIAHAAVLVTKKHLIALPSNRQGWPSTHFWGRAAAATSAQILPDSVLVSINQIGVRQRFLGGPIAPVNAKALAIPVSSESYGKTPADFSGQLKLVVIKGKGAWLALNTFEQRARDTQHGRHQMHGPALTPLRQRLQFLFRLSSGVNQAANPGVLPTDEEYATTSLLAAQAAITE